MNNLSYVVFISIISICSSTSTSSTKRILVVGGSGRVGGSAVRALYKKFGNNVDLTVGGRSSKRWVDSNKNNIPATFVNIDINSDSNELHNEIEKHDLIVNTAGPFQGIKNPILFESALKKGKKYIDVCDDIELSRICRAAKFQEICRKTGAVAIVSTGIWPGASSLLAKELIVKVGGVAKVDKLIFSFFTAGSGGAGQTILTTTFLLLGDDVQVYENKALVFKKPATNPQRIDFGKDIGVRTVVRLNLIECESCAVTTGIPNIATYFGTAPVIWNWLFVAMARIIPQSILQDRIKMELLAKISLPMVRLVDMLVGSKNGIRVDVTLKDGSTHTALLTHNDLETCVGDAIAAFATQMIFSSDKKQRQPMFSPGVFFPEEISNPAFSQNILKEVSQDAISATYF